MSLWRIIHTKLRILHSNRNGDTSSWAEDVHPGPYDQSAHPAIPDEGPSHPAGVGSPSGKTARAAAANARDAMSSGGTLTVTTGANSDNVVIDITDTGTGIREEHIDKIFDSFFTTKDSVKGGGLGLSVCYGFIKDHGGDIDVKSKVDSGTTFTITFPIFQQSAEKNEAHS